MAHNDELQELTNWDIDAHYRSHPLYGGCCPQDQLPPLAGLAWVVNLQPSTAGSGSHWVSCIDARPSRCYYYDSMGMPPPPAVLRRMVDTGKQVVWSRYAEQALDTTTCGFFACFVVDRLLAGQAWTRVIRDELQPARYKANDREVLSAYRRA